MPSLKREQVRFAAGHCCCVYVSAFSLLYLCFSGYGGGFNERENVEYIEREESDGEYDEVSLNFLRSLKVNSALLASGQMTDVFLLSLEGKRKSIVER